ncbi:MAG TPA: hypothetical protein VF997_07395 [Polyangia bacterium]
MPIEVDLAQPPVVFTKFDGEQTLAELERYIADMDAVFARGQRYFSVTWMKRWARDPEQLRRTARWFQERERQIRELCVASTIISTSATFRFALSTLLLIRPLYGPYTVCSTFDEAVAFGQTEFRKRGLRLPPSIRNPWSDFAA